MNDLIRVGLEAARTMRQHSGNTSEHLRSLGGHEITSFLVGRGQV